MQYHAQPITVQEGDLPKFRYRPEDTLQTASSWELPLYGSGTGELHVKGLDTCHHLESGTCWWFLLVQWILNKARFSGDELSRCDSCETSYW